MKFSKKETLEIVINGHDDFEHVHSEVYDSKGITESTKLIVKNLKDSTYWLIRFDNHNDYGIDLIDDEFKSVSPEQVASIVENKA